MKSVKKKDNSQVLNRVENQVYWQVRDRVWYEVFAQVETKIRKQENYGSNTY